MNARVVPLPGADRHPFALEAAATDSANAAELARLAGGDLHFVSEWGTWIAWDGQLHRADDQGRRHYLARQVANQLFDRAAAATDDRERRLLVRAAMAAASRRGREASIALAETEDGVPISADTLDRDRWLLNTPSGTLDLRSADLRPHRRGDFITRITGAPYIPGATDEILDAFLDHLTGGDREFLAFLQRGLGYTLAGDVGEEVVFLGLGSAGTGKTTLIEAALATLGTYGVKASFDTFLERRDVGGPRPDLLALRGARMVAAVEAASHRHLASPIIKEWAGGDSITVRGLYHRDQTTFKPQGTLWLCSNDAPRMRDDDTGLWRRLRRLPFENVVARPDAGIKRHLTESPRARAALLAWCVQGCLAWQREGLGGCAVVAARTTELRSSMSPVAEFLEQHTVAGSELEVPVRDLRAAYEHWCQANGARPVSGKEWATRLRALGCERRQGPRPDREWHWRGITLTRDTLEP